VREFRAELKISKGLLVPTPNGDDGSKGKSCTRPDGREACQLCSAEEAPRGLSVTEWWSGASWVRRHETLWFQAGHKDVEIGV